MPITKIDSYDFRIVDDGIEISIDGTNDPTLVDILSELDRTNGRLYVDGEHYLFTGYNMDSEYLYLFVTNYK